MCPPASSHCVYVVVEGNRVVCSWLGRWRVRAVPRAGVRCGVGSNLGAASRGVNSTSAWRAWSSAAGSWRSVARRPSEYVCLGAPGCPLRRDGPAACVVGPCAAFARGREAGLPRCWLQEGCTGLARRCDGQCCEPRMNLARTGGLLACRRVSGPHRTVSVESPRLRGITEGARWGRIVVLRDLTKFGLCVCAGC